MILPIDQLIVSYTKDFTTSLIALLGDTSLSLLLQRDYDHIFYKCMDYFFDVHARNQHRYLAARYALDMNLNKRRYVMDLPL